MAKLDEPHKALHKVIIKAKSPFTAVDFDFRSFCQNNLSIRRSDVYTHHIHSYPGKLLPYIPAFFLSDEKLIPPDGDILDPFAGSGTVLLESLVNPHFKRNALGTEINPLGRLISRVKTTPLDVNKLHRLKREVEEDRSRNIDGESHSFEGIERWFAPKARLRLRALRKRILRIPEGPYRDFFLVCFSRIVRKCSLADPHVPPPVVLKLDKYAHNESRHAELKDFLSHSMDPDVDELFSASASSNIARLKSLVDSLHNEKKDLGAAIIWNDARDIKRARYHHSGQFSTKDTKRLRANSISGIITSPPYLTAQKYVRSTKLEMLWLGLLDNEGLLDVDHKTIGTERTPCSVQLGGKKGDKDALVDFYCEEVPRLADKISALKMSSYERALDVGYYFFNMTNVLKEMHRVLKSECYAVVVLGNSKVLGSRFPTHYYLAKVAEDIGFTLKTVLRDPIRTRGMLTGRNKTGGLIEDEHSLVLQK